MNLGGRVCSRVGAKVIHSRWVKSVLESEETDREVEHELLCHVRVVGTEVTETQAEVEVIDSEMLRAEFQIQVGVCETIGGLEVGSASGGVEFQSPSVTFIKEIITKIEADSAVGGVVPFVAIVAIFCHADDVFDRNSYGQTVPEGDSRGYIPVKCHEFRIIEHIGTHSYFGQK